jgi:D-arabinose 1-dehydrogenase-like Zn-dependent alcohol dehydrogenase
MQAAVLERFDGPLGVREVPAPVPGPGQVLVRARASCLCQTDLKVPRGAIPTVQTPWGWGASCRAAGGPACIW